MVYARNSTMVLALVVVVALLATQKAEACPMSREQAYMMLSQIRANYPDLLNQQQQQGQYGSNLPINQYGTNVQPTQGNVPGFQG